MSLRPYVPAPLCPCALMSAPLCPAPLCRRSPVHDLILVENLERFAHHNSLAAKNAQVAFTRHMWYLAEELATLALFSSM